MDSDSTKDIFVRCTSRRIYLLVTISYQGKISW